MVKKIVLSAKESELIKSIRERLNEEENIDLISHDPTIDFLNLRNLPKQFRNVNLLVVKVRNECSIDLLYFAKIHNIPTLHDIDTVLICKNKVALDQTFRNILPKYPKELSSFAIPYSWTQSLRDAEKFKNWAKSKLPFVIKSHNQHDKYNRFNFLVRKLEEIDDFRKKYSIFLYYNVYIQKFIECDGIERKINVVGDKIFGTQRENPIYYWLRKRPESINVKTFKREKFEISDEMKKLAEILSKELKLKLFNIDLLKPLNEDCYYIVDLNDFPGYLGIKNIDIVITNFIKNYVNLIENY
ncbi:MAG: RimK family alpha-L-glutamate ligase [Promethearchaeota archaeon]